MNPEENTTYYMFDPQKLEDGSILDDYRDEFSKEPTPKNFDHIIAALMAMQTLNVPMNAVMSDEDKMAIQNLDEGSVGDTFAFKHEVRLRPDWLKKPDEDGVYLPVFSIPEEIPEEYRARFTWISTTMEQCINIFDGQNNAVGIVVDPFTKPIELGQDVIDYMKSLIPRNEDLKAEMAVYTNNEKHKYTARLVEYCEEKYANELNIIDERSYCYNSLPICIVDCVYSLRARYNSVTVPIVERYANEFLNGDKTISDENDTLADFIYNLTTPSLENFAENIAKNHQILGGVPKEQVCLNIAKALQGLGINTLNDFREYSSKEKLANVIRSVKGIGNAGVSYLFMLAGDDSKSKPDVHIHRCIAEACGEDVSDEDCQKIIEESVDVLRKKYPSLTTRKLDGVIWRDFSSRRG